MIDTNLYNYPGPHNLSDESEGIQEEGEEIIMRYVIETQFFAVGLY